jgi:uncharacterized membrane protein YoaK (UPF0700 family)
VLGERPAEEHPRSRGPRERAQAASAVLLALAAGAVDAVSFVLLHHVFTANMTGNTTKLGIAAGRDDAAALIPLAVAVALFVAAIVLATTALELAARHGVRATAAPLLGVEAGLVTALMVVGRGLVHHNTVPGHTVGGFYVLLALAILAMGTQTAALTKAFGQTLRTTYVSGLLTTFSQELVNAVAPGCAAGRSSYLRDDLRLGGRRDSIGRLGLHLGVWASFLAGATWGGYGEQHWRTWALALPIAVLLAAAAVDLRQPVHRAGHEGARRSRHGSAS